MSRICLFCNSFDVSTRDADKKCICTVSGQRVSPVYCCPAYMPKPDDVSPVTGEKKTVVGEQINASWLKEKEPVVAKSEPVFREVKHSSVKKEKIEREESTDVTLYEHQKVAREKFKDKDEIALFFEMGCGKTLTSMMIICDKFKAGVIDSLLVVAPNYVHTQWYDDLCDPESTLSKAIEQEGVPCIGQIIGGYGGQKKFLEFDPDDNKLHIVCTNIDTFSQPHKWEEIVEWANSNRTAIIIDEATTIKNPSSKRSQRMLYEFNDVTYRRKTIISNMKKPNTKVRIVLTGTPVSNGPMDLWSIMEFIKPNYFNRNYYSFMNYYGMHTKINVEERTIQVLLNEKTWKGIHGCNDYSEAFILFGCSEDTYMTVKHQDHYLGPYKHADELKVWLEPNAVFAKLVDCVDMPPCNYIVKQVALSSSQLTCYNDMKKTYMAQFDGHVASASSKLIVSMRLQQIASGFIMAHKEFNDEDIPVWDDESFDVAPDEVVWLDETNPKLEQLMRDVDELDKPIIILTRFSAEAAKIYDLLKDKYNTCLFTGWKVIGSIDKFKDGEHDIIVANTAKIARGFNLQRAHTTLYYSNTFSMELRQQSEFRTFRMGQKSPCTYVDYVSCDIDKTVLDALKNKKKLLDYIRDKDIKEM